MKWLVFFLFIYFFSATHVIKVIASLMVTHSHELNRVELKTNKHRCVYRHTKLTNYQGKIKYFWLKHIIGVGSFQVNYNIVGVLNLES